MSSKVLSSVLVSVVACLTVAVCLVSTAQAGFVTVAEWKFDGANFLADSSGNGHTLENIGTTQVGDAASFSGSACLSTIGNVDLSPYTKVRVSWSQNKSTDAEQIAWEHAPKNWADSSGYAAVIGGMITYQSPGPLGTAGMKVAPTAVGYDMATYPYAVGTWQNYAVEMDPDDSTNPVKVYQNGSLISTTTLTADLYESFSFANTTFNIGARRWSNGGAPALVAGFVGQIDNLMIEGTLVPEPGTISLLGIGLLGLLAYAWRKRK